MTMTTKITAADPREGYTLDELLAVLGQAQRQRPNPAPFVRVRVDVGMRGQIKSITLSERGE